MPRPSAVTWHVRNGIDTDNLERGNYVAGVGYTSTSVAAGLLLGVNIPLIEVSGTAGWGPVLKVDAATHAWNTLTLTWTSIIGMTYDFFSSTNNTSYTAGATGISTPYSVPSITANGARNWYKISATDGSGNVVWSQAISVTNATVLTLTPGASTTGIIGLAWTPGVTGAASYKIYRDIASGMANHTFVGNTTGTSYSDTGTTGTAYWYTVVAVFPDGSEGVASEEQTDTAP